MIRPIIAALLAVTLIALIVMWVMNGGPRRIANSAANAISGAVDDVDPEGFRLPWQPAQLFPTLDITDSLNLAEDGDMRSTQEKIADLEAEYERLNSEASLARTFGTPSPHRGKVALIQNAAGLRAGAEEEYLEIAANFQNNETIDIAGWTIESALSGLRIVIPPAASPFIANSANVLGPVALEPGAVALVVTKPSPVGVSFRENSCTGYLGQFQSFYPPLDDSCPSPSSILPLTEENLQRYGDSCYDAIAYLSSCRFPDALPTNVSGACSAYLTQQLSYNGCMQRERFKTSFSKNTWRIFLGSSQELWRNSHDAIRLLDAQGRTVSVFVY